MKWNKVRVGDFLIRVKDLVPITKNEEYSLVTIKLYHRGVQLRKKVKGSEIQADKMSRVKSGQFILSGIDARNGAFGIVPPELDGAVVTNDFWHFEIDKSIISNEYFLWLTSTPYFDDICNKASDGTTNRIRLQADRFYSQELLLPRIQDQHKVVEELKSRSNKIISLKDEYKFQLKQIEDLNRAILQEAFQGKLVSNSKESVEYEILINSIKEDKEKLTTQRKYKPLIASERPDIKALIYEIPKNWKWFRLGDVAFFQEGPGIRVWQFTKSGIKLLNVQNILKDDTVDYLNSDKYVSMNEFTEKYKHFQIQDGDILWASSGASWGKIAWHKDPGFPIMLNTSTVRLKFFSSKLFDPFLFYFLKTEFFKIQMVPQLMGMQPNFGATHLSRTYIPIPPLEEQKRIVAEIEKQLAKTKQLKEHIIANQEATEQLLKALLHQAFEVKE